MELRVAQSLRKRFLKSFQHFLLCAVSASSIDWTVKELKLHLQYISACHNFLLLALTWIPVARACDTKSSPDKNTKYKKRTSNYLHRAARACDTKSPHGRPDLAGGGDIEKGEQEIASASKWKYLKSGRKENFWPLIIVQLGEFFASRNKPKRKLHWWHTRIKLKTKPAQQL